MGCSRSGYATSPTNSASMPLPSGWVARARLAGGHEALDPHTENGFSLLLLGHEKRPEQVGTRARSLYQPGCLQALRCSCLLHASHPLFSLPSIWFGPPWG